MLGNKLLRLKSVSTDTISTCFSFALSVLLFLTLSGTTHFGDFVGLRVDGTSFLALSSFITILASFVIAKYRNARIEITSEGFALGLLILFCSDWFLRGFSIFQGQVFRGEVLIGSLLSLSLLFFPKIKIFNFFALFVPLFIFYLFLSESHGRVIFSDDHPSMLYRLQLLKDNFPFIPLYNTQWNAGTDWRDFFATGILNTFFLFAPLIYSFDIESIYNIIFGGTVFALLPLAVFYAAKKRGLTYPTPQIASILAILSHILWYRWCLKYGAIGFLTASALVSLNIIFTEKMLSKNKEFSLREAFLFILSFSLMLFWSLTGIIFIPAILFGLFQLKRLFNKRYFAFIAGAILILNLPWIMIFLNVSQVSKFTSLSTKAIDAPRQELNQAEDLNKISPARLRAGKKLSFEEIKKQASDFATKTNPAILLLAIPGLALLHRKKKAYFLIATVTWLLFLGFIVNPLKPQLELERMLIVLTLFLTIPAAEAITELFHKAKQGTTFSRFAFCITCGFIFSCFLSISLVIKNRTSETYTFKDRSVSELAEAIKQFGGTGRTLFASFILHELNGGHIAPLAYMTSHPLIASSPIHNLWRYVDVIPERFRKDSVGGIELYLDFFNVTSVIAFNRDWKSYFDSVSNVYTPVWSGGIFKLYTRSHFKSTYFLEGEGEILEQNENSIVLRLDSEKAIIKFNYFDFLEISECAIAPYIYSADVKLISITDCQPGKKLKIKSKNAFHRILG